MAAWLERLRLPFAAVGGVALLGSAAYYLAVGEFGVPARILLALAILFLGMYVAVDPSAIWRAATSRGARYGSNTVLMSAAFLGILGILNFLVLKYDHRWDLTENHQYTLSQETKNILSELKQPVKVTGFFTSTDVRERDARDLLGEYNAASGGKFQIGWVDPDVRPAEAAAAGIKEEGTLVFQYGNRRQDVTGTQESDFTTALLKLTRTTPKKVYFLAGHGERDITALSQNGYSEVKRGLDADNYQVETLNLITAASVPADCAVLVIASPQKPLLDQEKKAIEDYLDGGGSVMVLVDPHSEAQLADLVKKWDIQIGQGVVLDPGSNFMGDIGSPVIQRYIFHSITKDLPVTFFPLATNVTPPKNPPKGVSITPLMETTDRSWVEMNPNVAHFDPGVDTKGPVDLGVAVEAEAQNAGEAKASPPTASATPGRAQPTATPQPASSAGEGTSKQARLVIIGDSDFAANGALRVPVGNEDLFLNSVNWLAESADLIAIHPKPPLNTTIFLTATQSNMALYSSVLFLPLLPLVAGAAVWWSRR